MSELTVDVRTIGADLMAEVIEGLTMAVDALDAAAVQFRKYETLHRAKATPDSIEKAEVNNQLASKIESTLETIKTRMEKYNA